MVNEVRHFPNRFIRRPGYVAFCLGGLQVATWLGGGYFQ
jgi:hypothetical protein